MDNPMNTVREIIPPVGHYHAYDAYYRANAKGTGSAVKIELHPAHDDVAGSIFVSMAMQRTIGTMQGGRPPIQGIPGGQVMQGPSSLYPTYDWQHAIRVKLDRTDLSQILQVLRGMQESIADGKGLFHRSSVGNTIINFSHQIEPRPGYLLQVSRKPAGQEASTSAYYFFDVNEAFTLMLALERSMVYVCFGIPEVIPRPSSRTATPSLVPAPQSTAPHPPVMPPPPPPEDYRAASGDPF